MQATRIFLCASFLAVIPLISIERRPDDKPFITQKKDNPRTVKMRACPAICDVYSDRSFFYIPETINQDARFCMWTPTTRNLLPLADENIIINYAQKASANPLRSHEISAIHMMNGRPFITCSNYDRLIYFDTYKDTEKKIIISDVINDADGKPIQGIVNFAYGITGNNWRVREGGNPLEENDWIYQPLTYILMAVKGSDAEFGQHGSGFAVIKPFTDHIKEKIRPDDFDEDEELMEVTREQYNLKIIDAVNGYKYKPWLKETEPKTMEHKAVPLTPETAAFSYHGGVGQIEQNHVALHFDAKHDRFYIGLDLTTKEDASEDQGASALAAAYIYNNQLVMTPFMPLEFLSADSIWGTVGPNKRVTVHHITHLETSTCLPYLIIVGGQGDHETTARTVWALPQYHENIKRVEADPYARTARDLDLNEPLHGTCAARTSRIRDRFGGFGNTLEQRTFDEPIAKKEDAPTCSDMQFLVGGEQLPARVTHLEISHDAIFATVDDAENKIHRVYLSQPVFDANGIIAGWTQWLCVRSSKHPIIAYYVHPDSGTGITAVHRLDKHKVKITQHAWIGKHNKKYARPEHEHLITLVEQHLPKEEGGVQGLLELDDTITQSTILAITGYKKVVLTEQRDLTCTKKDGYQPDKTYISDDGKLTGFDGSKNTALVISGGAVAKLGPINAAAIGTDGKQSWLFVSGVYGIAQLRRPDGSGVRTTREGQTFFEGLDDSMSFVSISDLRFVKKLVAHGTTLYALNFQTLQAHDLTEQPRTTTVATALEYGISAFNDCVITDGYMLLGTSHGLLHKSQDSRRFDTENKLITYPIMSIISTQPVRIDGRQHQNIFVLTGSFSRKSSHVYRLYGVYDTTHAVIAPLNDFGKKNVHKSILNCPHLRTLFATDGALTMSALSGSATSHAAFHVLASTWSAMQESRGFSELEIPPVVPQDADMCTLMRSRITGCWMVAGNFGVHILET